MSNSPFAGLPKQDPRYAYTAGELLQETIIPPVDMVEGVLVEGKDAILGGAYGIGKTSVCLHFGAGLSTGENVFGLRVTRPYRVLYFDLELGKAEFQHRLRDVREMCTDRDRLDQNFVYIDATPDSPLYGQIRFNAEGSRSILELTKLHRAEVVIIDNLSLAFTGDMENPKDCMALRGWVSWIRKENPNVRLFFLPTHLTKPNAEKVPSLLREVRLWLARVRGSGKLLDHFTIRLGFDMEQDSTGQEFYVLNGISSHGEISPICLEKGEQGYLYQPHSDKCLKARTVFTKAELTVWDGLPDCFTWEKIKRTLGTARATGQRMLQKAKANHIVEERPKGTYWKHGFPHFGNADTSDTSAEKKDLG